MVTSMEPKQDRNTYPSNVAYSIIPHPQTRSSLGIDQSLRRRFLLSRDLNRQVCTLGRESGQICVHMPQLLGEQSSQRRLSLPQL